MTDPIITGIISSGIFEGSKATIQKLRHHLANHPETVEDLGNVFESSLRSSIEERTNQVEDNSLDELLDEWDSITKQLNSKDVVFNDEEEAVTTVTNVLLSEINCQNNMRIQRILRTAVTEAFKDAVSEFSKKAEKGGSIQSLSLELEIDLLRQLRSLQSRLDESTTRFQYSQFYSIYDVSSKNSIGELKHEIANQLGIDISASYIPRKKPHEIPSLGQYLIVGRRGIGKSRFLLESMVKLYSRSDINHIIVPHEGFSASSALDSLLAEDFDDSTLLLWDDIHDITSIENAEPFKATVLKLRKKVDGELSVIATARSEHMEELTGIERWEEDSLWRPFQKIEIQSLSRESINNIILKLDTEDLINQEVRKHLGERITKVDPSPFYAVSSTQLLLRVNESPSKEDVDFLPATGIDIWEAQYDKLRKNRPQSRRILMSVKLLDDLSLPLLLPLVRMGAEKVFNLDSLEFDPSLEELIKRQWLEVNNDEGTITIHGVQTSAIEELKRRYYKEISDVILENTDQYLKIPDPYLAVLHQYMGLATRQRLGKQGPFVARDHFKRAIELDSERGDAQSAYGISLMKSGELEKGLKHLREGAELASQRPAPQYNLGVALYKSGKPDKARDYLEKAVKLDPERPEIHSTLGRCYMKMKRYEEAEERFAKAESISPSLPHIYFSRAESYYFQEKYEMAKEPVSKAKTLLQEEGRYLNFLRALQLSVRVFEKTSDFEKAIEYCEQAFELIDKLQKGYLEPDLRQEDETLDVDKIEKSVRKSYLQLLKYEL